jgi:hypothetical protein
MDSSSHSVILQQRYCGRDVANVFALISSQSSKELLIYDCHIDVRIPVTDEWTAKGKTIKLTRNIHGSCLVEFFIDCILSTQTTHTGMMNS